MLLPVIPLYLSCFPWHTLLIPEAPDAQVKSMMTVTSLVGDVAVETFS
jgi:hypothetical protein